MYVLFKEYSFHLIRIKVHFSAQMILTLRASREKVSILKGQQLSSDETSCIVSQTEHYLLWFQILWLAPLIIVSPRLPSNLPTPSHILSQFAVILSAV